MPLIPKDLQRFSIDGQNISPQYIKATPSVIQIVDSIVECFRVSADSTYGMLQDALEPLCLSSQRHRLIRGMVHILEARLSFEESLDIDPLALREKLFILAGQIPTQEYPSNAWRDRILQQISDETHISIERIETGLYADLKDERIITQFEDIQTHETIAEYNLSMAKSLLCYARQLVFTIVFEDISSQSIRRMFQSLRFFNLLFDAKQITDNAWQFTVDGPSAVLPQPQKYATSLGSFLPTLYAFSSWHGTANIEIDDKKYIWQIKPDDFIPPQMAYPERIPAEAQQLSARIEQLEPLFSTNRDCPFIVFGPQAVWIPDFSIQNIQTHQSVHVEVLGFWRADYLNRRLNLLKIAPKNLILVLSDKLKIDKQTLAQTSIEIVYYKKTPRPQDVIAAAHKLGL